MIKMYVVLIVDGDGPEVQSATYYLVMPDLGGFMSVTVLNSNEVRNRVIHNASERSKDFPVTTMAVAFVEAVTKR